MRGTIGAQAARVSGLLLAVVLSGCTSTSGSPHPRPTTPSAQGSVATIPGGGPVGEGWSRLPTAPSLRVGQSVVWTGTQMVVWGGQLLHGGTYLADGEAFDPGRRAWSRIPAAPIEPRSAALAVWTGSRLLVWGGEVQGPKAGAASFADGGSYDPASGMWTELAPSPLGARSEHAGVWTGSRLLIWGGAVVGKPQGEGDAADEEAADEEEAEGGKLLHDGAAYDPVTNQWSKLSPAPIKARAGHVAVWTGRQMIVWGGATIEESIDAPAYADGAAYDPATDHWKRLPRAPVRPGGVFAGVWTGKRMVVWGGLDGEGASYDPATDRWRALPKAPISPLSTPSAVWTGGQVIVWGAPESQQSPERRVAVGAAYDPARNRWTRLPAASSAPGLGQSAIWTGEQMVVWGGFSGPGSLAMGGAFSPSSET
jgi:N-acetylneuraminic acid mutarotase